MAKQTSIIPFTGKLGNLIGYERNGKYFVRSMPEIVRQTTATRRAAWRFGMASRKAALIRHAFYPELDIRCDDGHINRLNRLFIAAGDNHVGIAGFRFNQHTGIDRFFTVAPRLSGNRILHIPPQTIARHKGVTALEVKVIATRIDFISRDITGSETITLMVDPDGTFEGKDITLDVPGKGTLVVVCQVRAMHKDGVSCNRQLLAAEIIAVSAPQRQRRFAKQTYSRQATWQSQLTPSHTYAHTWRAMVQLE